METLRSSSLGMLGHDTALKRPKIGKKWTGLNRYISLSTDIVEKGLWFLNALSTTFLLVMLVYPGLDTIFLFFYSSKAFYFKAAKRTNFKF